MNARANNQIIAIVGGSGAGKSWLVTQLCRLIGDQACRLSLDDFYRDRSHLPPARRARLNFDVPHAIDWTGAAEVLRHGRLGLPAQVPQYDFATFSRRPEAHAWEPRPIVFVEGLWLLRPPELRPLFDFSIYLDTPAELRGKRRLARDTAERGYAEAAVRRRLLESVLPMHGRYVEPQKRWADLVLAQPYRATEVKSLADHLWPRLTGVGALPCWGHETFRADLLSLLCEHEYAN
jgi:uridine kinase